MRARVAVVALTAVLLAACAPGTPDLGFSPSGSVPYGSGTDGPDGAVQLVARADGGVIANRSPTRPLTRIGADGTIDAAWGATLPNDCRRTSRTSATGSGVLFTCSHLTQPSGPETWQVWRVTAAGELDPTFGGGDGIVDVPGGINELDLVPLPNGGYLGLGYAAAPPSTSSVTPLIAIVFSANGTTMSSTPINIPVFTLPAGFDGWRVGVRLAATTNGVGALETVTTNVMGSDFLIGQYRVRHFDANGLVVDAPAFLGPSTGTIVGNDSISGLVALRDGRTALIGTTTAVDVVSPSSITVSFLRMLRTDGTPDPGFGVGGTVVLETAAGGRLQPDAIAATNSERFLVVVGSPPAGDPMAARFDAATGALDLTFGDGGRFPVFLAHAGAAVARADFDQVYVGGSDSEGRPAVARVWNTTTSGP